MLPVILNTYLKIFRIFQQFWVGIYILLVFSTNLQSEIIKIPQGRPTIQEGINQAANGDTVLVSPGEYKESINFNGKQIVVSSNFLITSDTSFILNTIINADYKNCVVTFENGENSNTVLCGFTITGGYARTTTRMQNYQRDYDKNSQEIQFWGEGNGGGIYCVGQSSPTLSDLIIIENIADLEGGGLYLYESNPVLERMIISQNRSFTGGGIASIFSRPVLSEVTIKNNRAVKDGGGIYIANAGEDTP